MPNGNPIRTNNRNRKDDATGATKTYALHLESSAETKAAMLQQKLSMWYGATSTVFLDGSKMLLIPPYQSILSFPTKEYLPHWLQGKQHYQQGYAQVQCGDFPPN